MLDRDEQGMFQGGIDRQPPPVPSPESPSPVQRADTPDQRTDTADPDNGAAAVLRHQVGAVGASFLRVRPWVVAGPAMASAAALAITGAPPLRMGLVVLVQSCMLLFFVAEAVGLARAGAVAFVSPRRLGWSLALTLAGLATACALTGAAQSPLLPMLLAPTGIAYAAFGARPAGLSFLGGLVACLVGLVLFSAVDPWPPLAPVQAGFIGMTATALAGVLLWFGVAALTSAHRSAALELDRLRRVALQEAALRVRDLEAVGAKVAHELKNPLAAVQALTQLAERERTMPDARDAVIRKELARMRATLQAYLSYARPLDDLQWRSVQVDRLVEDVTSAIEGRAVAAGVRVSVSSDAGAVAADPDRLQDALLNLAANALDATPRGGTVALSAALTPDQVVLTVADSGRGMDPETLHRVGTPYFTTRDGGTGLGVVLARTVARQHGGDLTYESVPGRGTVARLVVPRRPGAEHGG